MEERKDMVNATLREISKDLAFEVRNHFSCEAQIHRNCSITPTPFTHDKSEYLQQVLLESTPRDPKDDLYCYDRVLYTVKCPHCHNTVGAASPSNG